MRELLQKSSRILLVACLTMTALLVSGCAKTIRIIANDPTEQCRQCPPPADNDKEINEYKICQAKQIDKCRVLLGHDPQYDWPS